jgi:hypothetical protein
MRASETQMDVLIHAAPGIKSQARRIAAGVELDLRLRSIAVENSPPLSRMLGRFRSSVKCSKNGMRASGSGAAAIFGDLIVELSCLSLSDWEQLHRL